MKLAPALRRLLRLADDADQVTLLPAAVALGNRARVGFQNERVGMSIEVDLDGDLPYRSVLASDLGKVLLSAPADAEATIEDGVGYGILRVTAGLAAKGIASKAGSESTPFPVPPVTSWQLAPDWPAVLALVPFCAPKWMGALAGIRFAPGCADATDTAVFAQARVAFDFEGIVPSEIFRHWPTGEDTAIAMHGGRFFARVGEEIRWATLLPPGKFPAATLIPAVHPYASAAVDTERLTQAVQQIKQQGSVRGVKVQFGGDGTTLSVAGDPPLLSIDLPGGPPAIPSEIWVSWRELSRLTKVLRTPRTAICLGPAGSPLRLESGPLVLCLWPLIVS